MRVFKFASGLVVALAGVGAKDALAADVTVTTATTTPLSTSAPDGVSPGDVTVADNGSIEVDAGETAITVNSNNDVTVEGQLTSEDADNSTGILLVGGNSGTITVEGSISLTETYSQEDADDDDDLDGDFAIGTNRHGILLQGGGPAFTGDITVDGVIAIEGENSAAIRIDGPLVGTLETSAVLTVVGDNSYGVVVEGAVTGDLLLRGGANVRGENSGGALINAPVDGEVRFNGVWQATGFYTTSPPEDVTGFEPEDIRQGGAAVAIRSSVTGGVTIEGIGVEDDEDDDGDGESDQDGDTDDDATATLLTYGSAPALLIEADGADVVLGAGSSGFGLNVRGTLGSYGLYDGFDVAALRIQGIGGSAVTIAGGVALDQSITASALEADSYGLYINGDVTTPEVLVRRQMTSITSSETDQTAYGVYIGGGADVASFNNSSTVRAQVFGEIGDAVAIYDGSNSLAAITNSGTIQANITATDEDTTDDIDPADITGATVAIDVSASTIDVSYTQTADVPFTDDDAEDDDDQLRPDVQTLGDIRFGSGNDDLNILAGLIEGDVSFGAGADALLIDNGATYEGRMTDSDGLLTINVVDGELALNGGTLNITSASFGADAQLGMLLTESPADTTFIEASGTITFDVGARLVPLVPDGLPVSDTRLILTANGGLIGAGNVTGAVTGEGVPWLYNLGVNVAAGDPNSLEASYVIKTASELNLTANQTRAFDPIITALRLDEDAAAAMATLDTEFAFFDAYEDLLPSYATAATEVLATAIQQSQSAASNRLATTRLHGLNEVSIWAQEIAYGLNREPPTREGQEFRGQGFGIAGGIDGPLDNGALFGIAGSFVASEVEEPGRPQGEISTWITQGNAYLGTALGPVDLDFLVGVGFGRLSERRFVEIGDSYSALSEAEWWTYEGHGAARASLPLAITDWLVFSPQAAVTYVYMQEEGYTEEGGGAAIDYEADGVSSQRLWADAGAELSARFNLNGGGQIAPRIYAGYRANAIDEEAERTFRFVSGGSEFTLVDEPLGDGGTLVGLGIDATNGYSTFSLGYEGEFGDQIDRHSLNAAVRFRF